MIKDPLSDSLKIIGSFVDEFQLNPYSYLSERDVQCDLFSSLRKGINQNVRVPKSSGGEYCLNVVHSEYQKWFDLCCLDKEIIENMSLSNFNPTQGHDDYLTQLPCLLAMELKFLKGKRPGNFQMFLKDEVKIRDASVNNTFKHWLSICFIQTDKVSQFHKDNCNNVLFKRVETILEFDYSYVVTPSHVYQITKI